MASDFDRDNSVDRFLKGARRSLTPPEEAGPACLDAETLAAWADGGLDAGAVRLVEAHVANCARCQAMSAAFFAADDGAAASSKVMPFRTNRVMYWLPIAVGTIAATLVIWMGVRGRNLPEATGAMGDALIKETAPPAPTGGFGQAGTVARQEPASPAVSPPVPAKPAESKSGQRLDAVSQADARAENAKRDAAAARKSRANAPRQGQQAVPSAPAVGAAAAPPPPVQVAQPVTRATAPPPPVVTATPTPTPAPVQTQTAATSTAGQSASARESVMFRSTAAVQVVAEFASSDPKALTINGLPGVAGGVAGGGAGAGAGGRGGGGGGGRGGARAADAVSTLPVHWRILSSDVLEKSTDRMTWETITIAPPVQGLLHGSAPSATVCWIVGRAGLVLLTTDGRQFTRVTPPTTDDLTSVKATDALRATVTTAGGQTFTTTDGGKSWK